MIYMSSNTEITIDQQNQVVVSFGGLPGRKGDKGDKGDHGDNFVWAYQEVPTGTQDGSNQSFTLAHSPVGKVVCIYNGLEMQDTVDSSYSGTALTLITFAPNASAGDRFWVRYPYA
jgi:hypothetical protein